MINNDQAVFTVKDVLRQGSLIQYVVHDREGDWQFFPGHEVPAGDMMIVRLQDIIEYDKTIATILSLEKGFQAYRKSVEDEWLVSQL